MTNPLAGAMHPYRLCDRGVTRASGGVDPGAPSSRIAAAARERCSERTHDRLPDMLLENERNAMNCRMLVRKWIVTPPLWWAQLLPIGIETRRPGADTYCVDCPPDKSKRVAARIGREWARRLGLKIQKVVYA
jgi:hypothetical protein